jgi:hypothetical protein
MCHTLTHALPHTRSSLLPALAARRCNDACEDHYEALYLIEWSNADRDQWFAPYRDGSFPGGLLP